MVSVLIVRISVHAYADEFADFLYNAIKFATGLSPHENDIKTPLAYSA